MGNPIDRRTSTRARLEAAQDAFVIALRRLRAVEEIAARMRSPLDLEQAHELLEHLSRGSRPGPQQSAATLSDELEAMRASFQQARELLRIAEAEAALAA